MALRIRTKLFIGYAAVFILLSFLGAIALYNRNILFKTISTLERGRTNMEIIGSVGMALETIVMPANDFLITGDIKEKEEFNNIRQGMEEELKLLKHTEFYKTDPQIYQDILSGYSIIIQKADMIFALKDPVGNKQGALWMKEMDGTARYIIVNYLNRALETEKERFALEKGMAETVKKKVDSIFAGGAVVSVLIAVSFTIYLIRSILMPIVEFQKSVHTISEGHLDRRISLRDGFEINILIEEFNKMAQNLEDSYKGLEGKVAERTKELNELNKKLNELCITDGLTEVYNHRHFYERLTEEIKRANRYGRPLSLIIADIDYFKNYNDTYGHLEGDNVLKGVAHCIRSNVRENDMVARYGGEEFSIILPETGKEDARGLAERIRRCITGQPFPHKETQPGGNLTISLGVAAFPDDAKDPKDIVARADNALYRAKEKRRNRVEVA